MQMGYKLKANANTHFTPAGRGLVIFVVLCGNFGGVFVPLEGTVSPSSFDETFLS